MHSLETVAGEYDPEELLSKVNSGQALNDSEVEFVVSMLEIVPLPRLGRPSADRGRESRGQSIADNRLPGVDEIYSLLKVLGRGEIREHRDLVQNFLSHDDPLTVSLVLEILCLEWRETERYLEQVVNFALGVAWDEEDDVVDMALRVLGEYLREILVSGQANKGSHAQNVMSLLLEVLKNEDQDEWVRQRSYFSILRAIGRDWENIPSECVLIDFSDNREPDFEQPQEGIEGSSKNRVDWQLVQDFSDKILSKTNSAEVAELVWDKSSGDAVSPETL